MSSEESTMMHPPWLQQLDNNNNDDHHRHMTRHNEEECCKSKDDAWVDILVTSHSRRAGNQYVGLCQPGGPQPHNASCPDPEAAHAEVAQVLAVISAPSSQLDGDSVNIEPMNVPHRSKINGSESHLDEIYAPTIP
jgi:hypothetical protein